MGGRLADDPDLTNFEDMLLPTDVGGTDRVDPTTGPSQERSGGEDGKQASKHGKRRQGDIPADWSGLDPDPKSNSQVLTSQQEDPDEGINWGDDQKQEDKEDDR